MARSAAVLIVVVTAVTIADAQQPFAPDAVVARPVPQTGGRRSLWPGRPLPVAPLVVSLAGVAGQRPEPAERAFVTDQVLVRFRADAADADRQSARDAVAAVSTKRVAQNLELLTIAVDVPDAVAALSALPQVGAAEPNWILRHAATSNDPLFVDGSLWGMYGETTTPSNPFGSQAAAMWGLGFTGSSAVVVAVIDEGIDVNHPDLADNVWTNPFDPVDGVDNDGNGFVDDVHGWDFFHDDPSIFDGAPGSSIDRHGTHVAGTIGARGGNGIGVAGVNWNVTMIGLKFLGPFGGFTSDAILALDYLTDLKLRHGINVVATNNSWSGGGFSTLLLDAITRAGREGILFVAAAGNSASNNDVVPRFPASYDTRSGVGAEAPLSFDAVISVAAIDSGGARASFSNFGATSVDLGAPGFGVRSTFPGAQYGFMSGTSMATPHVTGAAALYASINPGATAAATRTAILGGGAPTPSLDGVTATGRRLNVATFATDQESFTDDPLLSRVHLVRAVHIAELRTRISARRSSLGLSPVAWSTAAAADTPIRATDIIELRAAVADIYTALGQTPPAFTDASLMSGVTMMKAAHVTELRTALTAIEAP